MHSIRIGVTLRVGGSVTVRAMPVFVAGGYDADEHVHEH